MSMMSLQHNNAEAFERLVEMPGAIFPDITPLQPKIADGVGAEQGRRSRQSRIGDVVGCLTIIRIAERSGCVVVRCECGAEKEKQLYNLTPERTNHCGGKCPLKPKHAGGPRKAFLAKVRKLVGQRFGRLTVIDVGPLHEKRRRVLVQCDCGSDPKLVRVDLLKVGGAKSCGGCNGQISREERIGEKYNKLTIIGVGDRLGYVEVRCDCGSPPKQVQLSSIRHNDIKSCGECNGIMPREARIGQRFGLLEVVGLGEKPSHLSVRCDCGELKGVHVSALLSGSTRTCGRGHVEPRRDDHVILATKMPEAVAGSYIVYLMFNAAYEIIYVGRTQWGRVGRSRMRRHVDNTPWIAEVCSIDFVVCQGGYKQANDLEAQLIRKHQPKHNIQKKVAPKRNRGNGPGLRRRPVVKPEDVIFQPLPVRSKVRDLSGQNFGHLEVLGYAGKSAGTNAAWWCRCGLDGNIVKVEGSMLTRGVTTSCGCLWEERHRAAVTARSTTHGLSYSLPRLYTAWTSLRTRLRIVRHYKDVSVCERWEDFRNFAEDFNFTDPPPKHQLDRIDPDGGYSKENCRFATPRDNTNNRKITVNRLSSELFRWLPQTELAQHLGVSTEKIAQETKTGKAESVRGGIIARRIATHATRVNEAAERLHDDAELGLWLLNIRRANNHYNRTSGSHRSSRKIPAGIERTLSREDMSPDLLGRIARRHPLRSFAVGKAEGRYTPQMPDTYKPATKGAA